ncbi:hypothetical protein [Pseudonocardia sp. NPDC049635]|uniref:Kiwa anti-phage protein KwaB-like domain-containing protein n=1 Tax=Pseudonocardia sp. NPDC049635 TaxID=3155506 RepID=UPI0033E336C3
MDEPTDWTRLDLADEVTLVLGFRPRPGSKNLTAGRVEIKKDLADALLQACRRWLLELQTKTRVPYDSDLHLDPGEYLRTTVSELTQRSTISNELADEESDQGTELYSILSTAFDSDDWYTAPELRRNFLFYAIVVRRKSGGTVAFVKQSSPQRVAKAGGWMTIFSDTLSEVDRPVFVLEPDVDIVVSGEEIAVLRPLAFERLFADLELSKELIPEHVNVITSSISCGDDLGDQLALITSRKVRARRLLRDISSFTADQWAARTNEKIREVISRRQLEPDDFFDETGRLAVEGEQVVTLLEVLASRYYTSDFDEEEMRADKVRRRL